MNGFGVVAGQVAVLFLLCAVGFCCNRAKILNGETCRRLSDFVMMFVTPCVIVKSFMRSADPGTLRNLLIATASSLALHGIMIAAARLVIRGSDDRARVYRFAAVFSNCAFMAIPLERALLGEDGVFYGSAYIAVFNILVWTYGAFEMSGGKGKGGFSVKKAFLNPGVIGVAIGLLFFFLPIRPPKIINEALGYMADLNTPLPMIIVGFNIANSNFAGILRDGRGWLCIALRLVAFPALSAALLYAVGIRGTLLTALVIAVSAPSGATTTMFASRYGADAGLSANLVSLSTLLSAVTMPLIVGLTRM